MTIEEDRHEAWNFQRFVSLYNQIAEERGGGFYPYIEDDNTSFLEAWFEEDRQEGINIEEFAKRQFESEQIYADDMLTKFMEWKPD